MPTTRRNFLLTSAAAWAASHWAAGAAWADAFPSKPITVIVPFPPGGNIDIVGRGVSIPLGRVLSQSVVVDNRGGGGGSVGAAVVARAKPDGYTLLVGTPGQLVTVPHMIKTPYQPSSFQPIGLACKTNMVLVGRKDDKRFGSVEDVIALAKQQPGQITVGHPGIGTPNHLAILQLESQLGIELNSVAYQGSAPALIDLQAGVIDLQMDQLSSSLPNLKAGKFQALAVLGPTADPKLPGVPTLAQAGYPSIDATTYTGVYAPAHLPAEVLASLSAALEQAVQDEKFVHNMAELGSIASFMAPAAFQAIIDQEEAVAKQMAAAGRLIAN